MNKKSTDKQYVAVFLCFTIQLITITLCTKYQNQTLTKVVAEKYMTEKKVKFSLEREKNEQIKGLIRNMWLFLLHIQLITIKLCAKFRNPKSSSCLEIFERKKLKFSLERKKMNK